MVSRKARLYKKRKLLRREYERGKISAKEYRKRRAELTKALDYENVKSVTRLEKKIESGEAKPKNTAETKEAIRQTKVDFAKKYQPEAIKTRIERPRDDGLQVNPAAKNPQTESINYDTQTGQRIAEQTRLRAALGIYSRAPLTTEIKLNKPQEIKQDATSLAYGGGSDYDLYLASGGVTSSTSKKTPRLQQEFKIKTTQKVAAFKKTPTYKTLVTPVKSKVFDTADRYASLYLATAKYTGRKTGDLIGGKTGQKYKQFAEFSTDTTAYAYDSFSTTIRTPINYVYAAGFLGVASTGVGAAALSVSAPALTTLYLSGTAFNVATSDNKARALGTGLGQLGGYYLIGYGLQAGAKGVAKGYRLISNTAAQYKIELQPLGKAGKIGGKSARIRAKKLSKAEIRKRSFNAQRSNRFYDTQTKELGYRSRSPSLKKQFVKERTIRIGKIKGQSGDYLGITRLQDKLLAGRGTLITSRYRGSGLAKGGGKMPTFKDVSKAYPKNTFFYAQAGKSGNSELLTLKGKQMIGDLSGYKPNTAKIPKSQFVNKPPKITAKGQLGTTLSPPKYQKDAFAGDVIFKPSTQKVGGYRAGATERIYSKTQAKILTSQRNAFIKDLSGGDLTNVKPNINLNFKPPAQNINIDIKPDTKVVPPLKIDERSDLTERVKYGVTPVFSFGSDVASGTKIDAAIKPDTRTEIAQDLDLSYSSLPKLNTGTAGGGGYRPVNNLPVTTITPPPTPPAFPPNTPQARYKPQQQPPRQPPRFQRFKLPSFNFKFKRFSFKSVSKPATIGQPRAYKPSVRASIFNLKGAFNYGSVRTGYGERFILPKKKKKRGFLL